jgi:hypothetical protein
LNISKDYKSPVVRTAVGQGIVLLTGCLVLDGGFFLAATLIAAVAYWVVLGFVVFRHPASPSKGDLIWASAGFAITLVLALALVPVVLCLRGQI